MNRDRTKYKYDFLLDMVAGDLEKNLWYREMKAELYASKYCDCKSIISFNKHIIIGSNLFEDEFYRQVNNLMLYYVEKR